MAKTCPLLKEPCAEHGCEWFVHLLGKDPQSGGDIDVWRCAVGVLPMLLVENSGQVRQTAAAVESFRNETVGVVQAAMQAGRTNHNPISNRIMVPGNR